MVNSNQKIDLSRLDGCIKLRMHMLYPSYLLVGLFAFVSTMSSGYDDLTAFGNDAVWLCLSSYFLSVTLLLTCMKILDARVLQPFVVLRQGHIDVKEPFSKLRTYSADCVSYDEEVGRKYLFTMPLYNRVVYLTFRDKATDRLMFCKVYDQNHILESRLTQLSGEVAPKTLSE